MFVPNLALKREPNRTSLSSLQGAFDDFLVSVIERKVAFDQQHRDPNGSINKFAEWRKHIPSWHLERHLFFVTAQFATGRFAAKDGSGIYNGKPIFDAFKQWYLRLGHELLGPNFAKKPLKQPFTLAFLDVEGSRQHDAAHAFQLPHIHALMLVHPKTIHTFKGLISQGVLADNPQPFSKLDIRPYRDRGEGVKTVVSYASKYARQSLRDHRHDMVFSQYPDVLAERYPFLNCN